MSMITLREHAMIHAMNDITDKPGWERQGKGLVLTSDKSLE